MEKMTVICDGCQAPFERNVNKVNWARRNNKEFYCTLRCYGTYRAQQNLPKPKKGYLPRYLNPGNKFDEVSAFRYHLRSMKTRSRKSGLPCTVSLKDLKEQWDKQKGICILTGWVMDNPTAMLRKGYRRHPKRASVDRIDSNRGYEKENIRFICLIAQLAKNNFSDHDVVEFAQAVVDYNF